METIHHILAKSYLAHFLLSVFGLLADAFLAVPINVGFAEPLAIVFLGLGPLLMLWAQYTSHRHNAESGNHYFHYGPYRFVRNPTHLGILMLVTGYTLIAGSLVFFVTTLVGFLISNIFFKKYESLHESSGEVYKEYKARTPRV